MGTPEAVPPAPAEPTKPKRRAGGIGRSGRVDLVPLAAEEVRSAVQRLLAEHPDLAADADAFRDTLEGLTDGRETVEALGERVLELRRHQARIEAVNDALRGEIADNCGRARRFAQQEEALEGAILAMLRAMTPPKGRVAIETALFTAWQATPSSTQRRLLETDRSKTPERLLVPQDPVPDRAAIKQELLGGAAIEGWELSNTPPPRLELRSK